MSKSIEDLRTALFETLEGVKSGTIDVARARAINELGKTICDSAAVEVNYLQVTGAPRAAFLEGDGDKSGVHRHRLP